MRLSDVRSAGLWVLALSGVPVHPVTLPLPPPFHVSLCRLVTTYAFSFPRKRHLVDLEESISACGFFLELSKTSVLGGVEVQPLDLMPQSSNIKLQQIDVTAHTAVAVGDVPARG